MTATAAGVAGVLFQGARSAPGSIAAIARHDLHAVLADESLELEIQLWVSSGGPDGEQLYCVADLVADRLTDPELAGQVMAILERDDAASTSLDRLALHCTVAGHLGAADWCRAAAASLRPAPAQPMRSSTLTSIGEQRHRRSQDLLGSCD